MQGDKIEPVQRVRVFQDGLELQSRSPAVSISICNNGWQSSTVTWGKDLLDTRQMLQEALRQVDEKIAKEKVPCGNESKHPKSEKS